MIRQRTLLRCGLGALLLFAATALILAAALPTYSHVRQTISEIGMHGSPVAAPFAVGLTLVAVLLLLFARGLGGAARRLGASIVPASVLASFGIALLGLAAFPSPAPWHNRFGLSSTLGYMTPAVLAVAWRRVPGLEPLLRGSWLAFAIIVLAIGLNLLPAFVSLPPGYFEYYGLYQRLLWLTFLGWCTGTGLWLSGRAPE